MKANQKLPPSLGRFQVLGLCLKRGHLTPSELMQVRRYKWVGRKSLAKVLKLTEFMVQWNEGPRAKRNNKLYEYALRSLILETLNVPVKPEMLWETMIDKQDYTL